ncbi:FAD-binding and (Fe-S)-binding domain-containing protein (plasmid) [Acinetobacter baumannii]|uniref:FAD-binding and (Fe-S)-binding domain-containing protein n=1 Tax=Acinetobacter baumannii TaxID=470 RepID=UPI000D69562E|nr:FAD-binding and (Fe-S)-binding domain-containing protein [Acinetobacter baumannii]
MSSQHQTLSVQNFLTELRSDFKGEIDISDAARHVYATDNSIYQRKPIAVMYPKDIDDLQTLMQLMDQVEYRGVVLTARGGGTGTNGQSLTDGIVVDISRHMNQILTIDPIKKTARVQAGVVKDQLNAALKPYGLFFAPELSTSNRATIGGMINTDASGQGSCRYGKTHHHVIALTSVLRGGEILQTQALDRQNWQTQIQSSSNKTQTLYQKIFDLVANHQDTIQQNFPTLNRSLTGYDLPHVLTEQAFNLNHLICGSEGTLGLIAEAELNLLPIPVERMLINIGYANFHDALCDAKALMALQPLSIETVDSKVLNLAKQDLVWHDVARYFPEGEDHTQIEGINLIEIDAADLDTLHQIKTDFLHHLTSDQTVKRLTMTTAEGTQQVEAVYKMRKRAVGLLGNVQGEKRPQPFVEDTAVPPEHLADYIAEFRALLDAEKLEYGMFGHVDAGVLHVRPLMDMKDPESLQVMKRVTDRVVELTHKYHGVLWGEHGKGLRSEYAPIFFGEAYPILQEIKALFDPYNQLNPGKIATPSSQLKAKLIPVTEVKLRGDFDRQIDAQEWRNFGTTMHCNGNGACFNYELDDPMCPSYKVTRDRIHSPKGRATLVKEWLRREQTGEQTDSFEHEVYEALHGCLSCKSCTGQCPVKVDIPAAKAQFLAKYRQRYGRQIRDYLLARLEGWLPKMSLVAGLYNVMQRFSWMKQLQQKYFKLVDLPLFHPQAKVNLAQHGAIVLDDVEQLMKRAGEKVIIVQDAFTRYFDTPVLLETVALCRKLGITPYILPYLENGKPLHVHGFLDEFEKIKQHNVQLFQRVAKSNVPMIGIDPAMTLVFRQEYQEGTKALDYQVLLLQEWLNRVIEKKQLKLKPQQSTVFQLASHCTERTQMADSVNVWQQIFDKFGLELKALKLGCCGMAGTYGHEAEHRELSKQIYAQSWQKQIDVHGERVLATGYSCRTQVKRFSEQGVVHPIQILNRCLHD